MLMQKKIRWTFQSKFAQSEDLEEEPMRILKISAVGLSFVTLLLTTYQFIMSCFTLSPMKIADRLTLCLIAIFLFRAAIKVK